MSDPNSKTHRSHPIRSGHEGVLRGADQDARLAAELRRNLLRRKQQQRARADGSASGENGDGEIRDDGEGGEREG